ncbi:MAG: hypothetical protein CO001_01050 [Candidatus Portnoybacteria bacterium CG_4_8_14_3_um_filter_40_10]|uniref:Radical SAM core domain-containing protein n=2 Tax=Candidatus Portnoyibacteriota TaxID=1817913 RepID=A0A2M7IJ16_9BACT|nr:MAG: hypothetical protein COV84_03460 [Candidatus Portnoybacteria bacterium CG11_big_fil_rev_8_21_14_0_20_40_15]PIS31904.1 MAG: hypothetical protein COT41_00490 [Candidatus Portnoybacteria bacterium CG08_land_8_20_14_0_20_40_83]PIW76495.1 MAG: hypothetical protein CO001_01050 [Candidatus Portnoybacteria bacterium CG_4_8_14_3_um_filter_40_10]
MPLKIYKERREKMYPILKNSRVRGAENDFFLHQFKEGKEFALEKLHAEILWYCNGENSVDWLSEKFSQLNDDLLAFFAVLEESGLLILNKEKGRKVEFPPLAVSPYLQDMQIEATGRCNLWCKHCYAKKEFRRATKKEMSRTEFFEVFDQMYQLNVAKCFISGGESFLRKDLPELIAYLAHKCIGISGIFTNGTIYRQDVVDALKEAGSNTTFLVSLDGPDAQINDFVRGEGNFRRTISFIEKVKEQGFHVTVNTVAMKQNVKQLPEICHLLETLGVNRWRVSIPREQGETIVNKKLIVPEWQDIFIAYEELLRYALRRASSMRLQLSSIFKTEFLETKTYYLYREDTACCEYKRSSLVLTSDGNLIACPASVNFVFGNVKEKSLREIWYSDLAQSFKTLPVSKTECRDCDIKNYCGGGCRIIAWKLRKNILAKDENACPLYRFFFNTVKPIFEKEGICGEKLEQPNPYGFDPTILQKFTEKKSQRRSHYG